MATAARVCLKIPPNSSLENSPVALFCAPFSSELAMNAVELTACGNEFSFLRKNSCGSVGVALLAVWAALLAEFEFRLE